MCFVTTDSRATKWQTQFDSKGLMELSGWMLSITPLILQVWKTSCIHVWYVVERKVNSLHLQRYLSCVLRRSAPTWHPALKSFHGDTKCASSSLFCSYSCSQKKWTNIWCMLKKSVPWLLNIISILFLSHVGGHWKLNSESRPRLEFYGFRFFTAPLLLKEHSHYLQYWTRSRQENVNKGHLKRFKRLTLLFSCRVTQKGECSTSVVSFF